MSGRLTDETLNHILNGRKYNCFVETGTFKGTTTLPMARRFKLVHTFDLDTKLLGQVTSEAKRSGLNNIYFHSGDTEKIFADAIKIINEKCIFYLDAHKVWGGGNKILGAVGSKDVPLLTEVKAINDNRNFDDIIICDDHRLFDNRWFKDKNKKIMSDWSEINEISILNLIDPLTMINSFVYDDKFIINLRRI